MATETVEEKTPEVESPAKEEAGVGDSSEDKEIEKEEADSPINGEAEKKKEVEDDESEEKDEEEEEDESKKSSEKEVVTPTSDRPTRERKKVERFSLPTPFRSTPSKSVSIEKGRGTPLREIPNVAYQLSKRKADDNLILLHTILYGKKAKAQMVKRNIGQFSGFVWSEKEEEKQRAKAKEKLDKCTKEKLILFCDVLDIPINRSHARKEELAVKVLEFLESPKASRDVILADREKQTKKRKSTPKTGKSGESSDTPAKGWFDLASARHSMGTLRINSTLLDLKYHPAASTFQVTDQEVESLGSVPSFALSKWASKGGIGKGKDFSADTDSDIGSPRSPQLRHRGVSDEKPSVQDETVLAADEEIKKERAKSLSVFGGLVSPKLRGSQRSFETALETLVEIANARSLMLSAYDRITKEVKFVGND